MWIKGSHKDPSIHFRQPRLSHVRKALVSVMLGEILDELFWLVEIDQA